MTSTTSARGDTPVKHENPYALILGATAFSLVRLAAVSANACVSADEK